MIKQEVKGVPGIWRPDGFDIIFYTTMMSYNLSQVDYINPDTIRFKVTANGVDVSSNFTKEFRKNGLAVQTGLYFHYTPPAGTNGTLAIGSSLQFELSFEEPDV